MKNIIFIKIISLLCFYYCISQECEYTCKVDEKSYNVKEAYANPSKFKVLHLYDWEGTIPDSLFKFTRLNELNLYLYHSSEFPTTLKDIDYICELSIIGTSKLKLKDIFPLIMDYKRIQRLGFAYFGKKFVDDDSMNCFFAPSDKIQEITKEIKFLKSVSSIGFSSCNIKNIPKELTVLTNLRTLALDENLIDTIPEYIGNITNLDYLDLSSNKFKYLPQSLFKLKQKLELRLDSNPQIDLKDLFTKLQLLENPVKLCLINCNIKEFPNEIVNCNKIEELELQYNNLEKFPEGILSLRNLKKLNLDNNSILVIPDSIYLNEDLEVLDLSDNKITKLPDNLKKCHKLRFVALYNNPISEEEIQRMQKEMPNTSFDFKIIKNY